MAFVAKVIRKMITRYIAPCWLAATLGMLSIAQAEDAIQWAPDLQTARASAQATNRPVLLHFWSRTCIPCLRLEQEVFARPEVGNAINAHYAAVKINTDEQPELAEQFGVRSIPCDVVVTPNGQLLYKTISPAKPETYIQKLVAAAQSPAAQIAQRLNQQEAATGQSASPTAQQALPQPQAPWAQQLSNTQLAAQQQAEAWQQGLQSQTRQFAAQSSQLAQDTIHQAANQVAGQAANQAAAVAQPLGESIEQFGRQVSQAADTMNSVVHTAQQPHSPVTSYTAGGQLEQLNPFVASVPQQAPQQAPSVGTTPNTTASPSWPMAPPTSQAVTTQPVQSAPPQGPSATPMTPAQPSWPTPPSTQQQVAPQFAAQMPVAPPPAIAPAATHGSDASTTSATAERSTPRVGLDGYCPVTLLEENRWTVGDKRFGAVHRGRVYLFASRKHQLEFLANPDRFSPVLAGIDPVVLTTQGRVIEGKRAHGVVYKDQVHGDQIYLFSSEESLKEFWIKPTAYAGTVRQAVMDGTVNRFLR